MQELDNRKKKILAILSKTQEPMTGKRLCQELHVSLRTLQGDIAAINKQTRCIMSSNKGYVLQQDRLEKEMMLLEPKSKADHSVLKYLILKDEKYQIDELADCIYMSTSALEKKLKTYTEKLAAYDLVLKRSHAHVWIDGNEWNKRRLIRELIVEETQPEFHDLDHIAVYFQGTDVNRIRQIVVNALHKYGYFSEHAYATNMIINIVIALYRMRSDSYIKTLETYSIDETIEYQIASEICSQYAMHWPITPSYEDIAYIATLLTGQIKPEYVVKQKENSKEGVDAAFLTEMRQILEETFSYYMLDIDISEFLYNFALHVDALIQRAKYHQSVNNNVLDNIRKNCPFIYDVAILIADKIATHYHIKITDEEIGYISIHVGFVIENAMQDDDKLYVLLLCEEYHQISEHIKTKLNQDYADKLVIYEGNTNIVDNYHEYLIDLVIATKELALLGKKVITISPFYSKSDKMAVDGMIQQCLQEKAIKQQKRLLHSVFHEQLFFKTDSYADKQSAIRFMAGKIIDFGLADATFADSVWKREKMSSTCFFDTFAIPHAIEMNAKKTMLCVLLSEQGILWDDQNIHIVLMIAVQKKDRKKFMKIYSTIIQALWDKEKAAQLVQSNSIHDFMNLLLK